VVKEEVKRVVHSLSGIKMHIKQCSPPGDEHELSQVWSLQSQRSI
jgi:hypothetical protein